MSYYGTKKPTYDAWRLPLYLPVTSARKGQRLQVWGCARPAMIVIAGFSTINVREVGGMRAPRQRESGAHD